MLITLIAMHTASVALPTTVPTSPPAPLDYRIDQIDPIAKPSYYSVHLPSLLKHWPLATLAIQDSRPEILRAIKTAGNKNLIGMVKHFEVSAPLEQVVEVCDRFEDYPKIWKDVLSVKIESRDRNRVLTQWTRKPPAFFLPKIRYRISTVVDKTRPDRVVYRHQLVDGNMVSSSDSLVVYEKLTDSRTRVSVLNFFDPDVGGFVRALAEGKVWKQSMRDAFKDDMAFRARVEHPDWSTDRISDEADRALNKNPINDIEYTELLQFE